MKGDKYGDRPGEQNPNTAGNYVEVNGLTMYYEVYGSGQPLVLLHGGGSTIQTSFGRIIPALLQRHQLIAIELQAHGRTGDRSGPISFEQDADDVAGLMAQLNIQHADFFGFSNGGMTAIQIAIRHPKLCRKIIAASILLKRNGAFSGFWEFMKNGTFEQMPSPYKEAFLALNNDTQRLRMMYQKCADRMTNFQDVPDALLKSISCPVLLINAEQDVATKEHVVELARLIPDCQTAFLPGGHGGYIGEITTLAPEYREEDFAIPLIEEFLKE